MTKTELIQEVAYRSNMPVYLVEKITNTLLKQITEACTQNKRVLMTNFGVFTSYVRPQKNGRHPKNGLPIVIKSKRVIKFRPTKALKDKMDKR